MRKTLILLLSLFISINSFGQFQSDDAKLNILYSKLENVKFADLNISKAGMDILVSNGSSEGQVQIPVKLTTSDRSKLTTDFTGEDFIFLL